MLPKCYQNLPYNGKRIFEKFYKRSLHKYKSERIATKLACCAVRKKYINLNGTWQARPDANDTDTTSIDSNTTISTSDTESDNTSED